MSDQTTETVNPQATETEAEPVENQQKPATEQEPVIEDPKAVLEALKAANKEAAKYRKQAEALAKAEQERKEAEMTETEKLKARLAEREAELKRLTHADLQRQAAKKAELPIEFAARLQGETLEELEADAKALAELLPKQPAKSPGPNVTNPPNAQPARETPAQIKAKYGMTGGGFARSIFDPAFVEQKGGGAFDVPEQEN